MIQASVTQNRVKFLDEVVPLDVILNHLEFVE